MSADRGEYSDEEERMVKAVGGRARGLVQPVRRIQREKAGRTLPNLEEAPYGQVRTHRHEVGMPHGRAETLERRLGGLQAWGRRSNTHSIPPEPMTELDNQQTIPKNHQWTRVRTRARPNNPLPHLDFPVRTVPLLWGAL